MANCRGSPHVLPSLPQVLSQYLARLAHPTVSPDHVSHGTPLQQELSQLIQGAECYLQPALPPELATSLVGVFR